MEIKAFDWDLSICKVEKVSPEDLEGDIYFLAKTDEELSLVCLTENAPDEFIERDDGWKAFRIQGVLDFSLIAILAPIADLLAQNRIGIFACSTYNTDYVLVKKENLENALKVLSKAGYEVV